MRKKPVFPYQESEDSDISDGQSRNQRIRYVLRSLVPKLTKFIVLLLVWCFFTIALITKKPHELEQFCVAVQPNKLYSSEITEGVPRDEIELTLRGRIDEESMEYPEFAMANSSSVDVWLRYVDGDSGETLWQSEEWKVYLLETETRSMTEASYLFEISEIESSASVLQLAMKTTSKDAESLFIELDMSPVDRSNGVIYAFLLLIFLYVLIIWDITDRTFAAVITSSAAIAVLALMDARPSLQTIVSWIDIDTLMLLFGMMIMVGVLSESGIFDYLAVVAYRQSKGHPWPLIFFLCCFTGILSAFLDNVTMVLLMVPVTIRLCEVMRLRTVVVLISIVIYSNLGGTLTPVGDPPNVIIATDPFVAKQGINFLSFTVHMLPGVLFSMLGTFGILYLMLRNRIHMSEGDHTRKSLKVLNKEMAKVFATTDVEDQLREDISKRIAEIKAAQSKKGSDSAFFRPVPNFIDTLAELEVKHRIKNMPLLIKSCIAMGFAVLLFFFHSLPFLEGAKLPWSAVLAALLLLVLSDLNDFQIILAKVEWSTLLFFAALFILMEAITHLGLIDWIGDRTVSVILTVSREHQLTVAVSLLLWVCAITSAFVDNIPITTMMLRLTIELAKNKTLKLPFAPLIWALAFGACFGGNGTLIGASANVVTAGLASQHGYKISFMDFFKIGFPIMLSTVFIVWIYLLFAHSLLSWH
ncbi:P protein-like [Drosophila willistoni]|uniref:P protein-like n=1 Tax=Drosophila willistoni TaxID=7260 RepID=UPI000C26C488|nr:P protein-like [Drosophila willistoni]